MSNPLRTGNNPSPTGNNPSPMGNEKKVILYSNEENDTDFAMARRIAEIYERHNWETDHYTYPEQPSLNGVQMLVTFGGDGTILHAARAAAPAGIPILGINMGGKGFIAELEPDDIELIEKVISGEYGIETRMMIDIEIQRGGKIIHENFALNDAVIKGDNKVVGMNIYADGQMITRFSGDGAIIATPTGSTAYSMSAGGPIVEPSASNIIVTPICAHSLEAKSFVLTAGRVIAVEISQRKDVPAYVSIDGGTHIPISREDTVRVSKSEKITRLVHLSGKSFYHRLSSKLISGVPPH